MRFPEANTCAYRYIVEFVCGNVIENIEVLLLALWGLELFCWFHVSFCAHFVIASSLRECNMAPNEIMTTFIHAHSLSLFSSSHQPITCLRNGGACMQTFHAFFLNGLDFWCKWAMLYTMLAVNINMHYFSMSLCLSRLINLRTTIRSSVRSIQCLSHNSRPVPVITHIIWIHSQFKMRKI